MYLELLRAGQLKNQKLDLPSSPPSNLCPKSNGAKGDRCKDPEQLHFRAKEEMESGGSCNERKSTMQLSAGETCIEPSASISWQTTVQLPEQTGLDYNPIKIRTLTDFQSSSDEFILATFLFW